MERGISRIVYLAHENFGGTGDFGVDEENSNVRTVCDVV
jgi:hypothetical protein